MKPSFYIKNLLKAIALLLVFTGVSHAKNFSGNVGNGDLIKQIEKSLIFNEDARNQISFYNKDNSKKESIFTLSSPGASNEFKSSSSLGILVTNSRIENLDLRKKEKLAYNATLIGQWEVAIELYKQVLVSEPKNTYAKLSLAVSYQKIGQFAQAKDLYYELLQLNNDSRHVVVGNLLGILTEESPRDAIYLLSRLAIQNPQSPTILANAAMAYGKIGNYEKSIALFERAINLDNSRVDYKYNLAIAYDSLSQYENALRLYSDIIKNNSQDQNISITQIKERAEFIKQKI